MKSMKTRLGRLIRLLDRKIEEHGIVLSSAQKEDLYRIKRIHAQSALKPEAKKKYKLGHDILYSLHAPEVECIGKGKLHKPYEFGNKLSIIVSGRNNFVLCAKSFHNNPYYLLGNISFIAQYYYFISIIFFAAFATSLGIVISRIPALNSASTRSILILSGKLKERLNSP